MKKDQQSDWEVGSHASLSSKRIIWIIAAGLIVFLGWASQFYLDEVSFGSGKVIASSKGQIIQSLDGGVLTSLQVKEGQLVQAGEILAQLDPTRLLAMVGESQAKLQALTATAARLMAEVNNAPLVFPKEIQEDFGLIKLETALYQSRRSSLEESLTSLDKLIDLIQQELSMTEPLVKRGAASSVEVLRLRRQLTETKAKRTEIESQYMIRAREELAKVNADIEAQQQIVLGRKDMLAQAVITSPVRGIVKDIMITTIGGVIPPNGKLMEIIPVDERLQIEAKISPRDIAYIRPGLRATVKISAYDYSIYGALEGEVELISPDTLQDEVNRDQYYYRVYIKTTADNLKNKQGKRFSIVPGMIATVEIHTGKKTVLDYLLKPFNKAKEIFRER